MRRGRSFCFAFLLACNFSLALCINPYFEFFYNKYHKVESTTEAVSSVSPELSSLDGVITSDTGSQTTRNRDSVRETVKKHVSESIENKGNVINMVLQNGIQGTENYNKDSNIVLQQGYPNEYRNAALIGRYVGIGVAVLAVFVVCGIIACCPWCCRKQKPGFIIGGGIPIPVTQQQQQPNQQVIVAHHIPPETQQQLLPPPYDTQPVLKRSQYSSMQQLNYQNSPLQQQSHYSSMQHLHSQYSPVQQEHQQYQQAPMNTNMHNPPSAPSVYEKY